jgi:hypothetical protein
MQTVGNVRKITFTVRSSSRFKIKRIAVKKIKKKREKLNFQRQKQLYTNFVKVMLHMSILLKKLIYSRKILYGNFFSIIMLIYYPLQYYHNFRQSLNLSKCI